MRIRICIITFYNAVAQADNAVCVGSYVFFVGYQDYGIAVCVNITKQFHDFYRCFAVQVTCRLIGKDYRWVVYQCPGYQIGRASCRERVSSPV